MEQNNISKVNFIAPFNQLGYGVVGYNIWRELRKLYDLSVFPIGPITIDQQEIPNLINDINRLYSSKNPSIKIYHEFALIDFPGSPRIGFPIFELDDFPLKKNGPIEINVKNVLKQCDILCVASNWAKQVLLNHNILNSDSIKVVPLGVDRSIFYHEKSNKKVFLSIGKTEIRKSHDILIKCFNKAFDREVELWIMWDNPFFTKEEKVEWEQYYKSFKCADRIKFIPRVNSHMEVANIMRQASVGVFPYKAEGWNLELLEMMSCGKVVIATNYSGPTEYINNKNSILLEPTGMIDAFDGKWFLGGGKWAKISEDDLIEKMRLALEMSENIIYNTEGIETAKRLTWTNTIKKLNEIL